MKKPGGGGGGAAVDKKRSRRSYGESSTETPPKVSNLLFTNTHHKNFSNLRVVEFIMCFRIEFWWFPDFLMYLHEGSDPNYCKAFFFF